MGILQQVEGSAVFTVRAKAILIGKRLLQSLEGFEGHN